jgi:zinc/manganese transport system ATP-binding protein
VRGGRVFVVELLRLEHILVGYERGAPLLPPIDVTIHEGEVVGILGPNGAGKSSLLKTILGLLPPLSGRMIFAGASSPRIGYVPQGHRPDPTYPLSALQVAMMGRFARIGPGRRVKREDVEAARAHLHAVGLDSEGQQPFRSLSGGQRQRVLLARALCADPSLLVLDEPTSELDPAAEHDLLSLVGKLTKERSVAVLFVTHEISAAAGFAETVLLLDRRQKYFEAGRAAEMITTERMSKLYGRTVEVRSEGSRTLVWISGDSEAIGHHRSGDTEDVEPPLGAGRGV